MHRGCSDAGPAAMLTIGKLGASDDQLAYYEQQVAQGLEDYFSGRGEAPGRWVGAGCGGIGLSGRVDRDGFMRAMHGCDPRTGRAAPPRARAHEDRRVRPDVLGAEERERVVRDRRRGNVGGVAGGARASGRRGVRVRRARGMLHAPGAERSVPGSRRGVRRGRVPPSLVPGGRSAAPHACRRREHDSGGWSVDVARRARPV